MLFRIFSFPTYRDPAYRGSTLCHLSGEIFSEHLIGNFPRAENASHTCSLRQCFTFGFTAFVPLLYQGHTLSPASQMDISSLKVTPFQTLLLFAFAQLTRLTLWSCVSI